MDHVRSDEGIKRGPRKKPGPKPSSPRRKNGQFLNVLSNNPAAITQAFKEYAAGATLDSLATKYQVTRQAIYGWLLGELGGDQHAALVTQALTARIAQADQLLEQGDNPLDTTRGDRMARWARQDLERRRPALYGAKAELVVQARVDPGQLRGELLRLQAELGLTSPAAQQDSQIIDLPADAVQQSEDKPA